MLLTIITFVIILGILVLVHELGHFIVARKNGVKVDEFGLGFPPRMKKLFKKGDTLFTLNWIPLGGFVKIKGEDGEKSEDKDSFGNKKFWQKSLILAAGVLMNFALAFVLFSIGFTVGLPAVLDGNETGNIRQREILINQVLNDSPADRAGLETGDKIISLDNVTPVDLDELQSYIASREAHEISFSVKHGDKIINKKIIPEKLDISKENAIIGVELIETGIVSYPFYKAIWIGAKTTVLLIGRIFYILGNMLKDLIFGAGVQAEIAGPIGIAALTGKMIGLGWIYVLQFTAILSINLGIINILPLPALDGGRILFAIIEKIRQKPNNQKIETTIHNIGFTALMILIAIVTYKDLVKWGGKILDALKNVF